MIFPKALALLNYFATGEVRYIFTIPIALKKCLINGVLWQGKAVELRVSIYKSILELYDTSDVAVATLNNALEVWIRWCI